MFYCLLMVPWLSFVVVDFLVFLMAQFLGFLVKDWSLCVLLKAENG